LGREWRTHGSSYRVRSRSPRSRSTLLTASIGARIWAGDERGALLADRLATSAARRLAILVTEHRATFVAEKRMTVVAIGHPDVVHVESE